MMPSPEKSTYERASKSLAALKPTLKRKPISVTAIGSHDENLNGARKPGISHADELRRVLQQYSAPSPSRRNAPSHRAHRDPDLPNPEEAAGIVQHQSAYIRQLEDELSLCKGELMTYKMHLNDVLDENARLLAANQTSFIIKDALTQSQPNLTNQHTELNSMSKEGLAKHMQDLEVLKKLHISKTGVMEQQLASTKEQLAAAERKIEELKSQLLIQESMSSFAADGSLRHKGVCYRCGQREALIANNGSSSAISRITSEKEELIETLANIKRQLLEMQEREAEAVEKIKAGIQITEQASIEKAEAFMQREHMREELSSLKLRHENLMEENKRALQDCRDVARNELRNEIAELERRLIHSNEEEGNLKAQIEKMAREKEALTTELQRYQQELAIYQSSMVESTTGRRVDLTQLACDRDMAVEEKNKLKNRLLKVEQVKDEAVLRMKQELEGVRSRLDQAERDLILSQEEVIRLTKTNQDLEKQVNQIKMAYNSIDRSRNDGLMSLTRKLEAREEELQRIITDTESRYSKLLNEVEGMYVAQSKLVGQLRDECEKQADTIEQLSSKYKNENKQLRHENQSLTRRMEKKREQLQTVEVQEIELEKVHKKLRSRLSQLDEENISLNKKANELAIQNSEYQREIDILAEEVKFLRCHLDGDDKVPHDRLNTSAVDNILDALNTDMKSQDENLVGSIKILREVSSRGDH